MVLRWLHSLSTFTGGVSLAHNKLSCGVHSEILPPPPKLYISLRQHIGAGLDVKVRKGDKIARGHVIASSREKISSVLHSPCNALVDNILDYDYINGGKERTVVLSTDGEATLAKNELVSDKALSLSPEQLIEKIRAAGIVGLGGAMFPTYAKLSVPKDAKIDTLLINLAECEPYITADHRLSLEKPEQIIRGIHAIQRILKVRALIAIEDNKRDSKEKLECAIKQFGLKDITTFILKSKYPQGAEKALVKSVLNRRIQPGKLPSSVGCIVQNVATCYAVYEAVYLNKPLYERLITVTGDCVSQKVYLTKIGTPVKYLLEKAGLTSNVKRVIAGGPMMGFSQAGHEAPIIKGTNCIIALSNPQKFEEKACISCSRCVDACPMQLMPNYLARASKSLNHRQAEEHGLFDCYECGCCSYICPSRIDHLKWHRMSKKILGSRGKI